MTKMEFMNTMRMKLTGEVPGSEIENTIHYYEEYFSEALRNGRSESEVIEELGEPGLIARTIIDTAARTPYGQAYSEREIPEPNQQQDTEKKIVVSKSSKILPAVILVVVLLLLFSILKALIPFIVPILVIYLVYQLIRKKGH